MSNLTGLINRALSSTPGWEASSVLPIQRRVGPAPAPVVGTDESGRTQRFTQPPLALGVPDAVSSPIQSLMSSSAKLEQGQVPDTKDVMPFLLAAASPSLGSEGDAALSAGARFRVIEGGKKAIPVVKGTAPAAEEVPKSLGFFLAHKKWGDRYDYDVVGKKLPPEEGSFGLHVTTPFQSQAEAIAELQRMKRTGETKGDITVLPAETMQRYLQSRFDKNGKVVKGTSRLDDFLEREKQEPTREQLDKLKYDALDNGLINRPNITPGSIAAEHQLDMATSDRLAAEAAKPKPKDTK